MDERYKKLRELFRNDEIKGNFLIKILSRVEKAFGGIEPLQTRYPANNTDNFVAGRYEFPDYNVCKIIIGIHSFNTMFFNDIEKSRLVDDVKYEEELLKSVVENIKLYQYSGYYFRRNQITSKRYLYFPLLYDLYAMNIKISEIVKGSNDFPFNYIGKVANTILGAFTLIESGFVDEAYALCRMSIELFFIWFCINENDKVLELYDKHLRMDLEIKSTNNYPEEFNNLFENRLVKKNQDKFAYLHFGWVDKLSNYHQLVHPDKAYSIPGIVKYLINKYPDLEEKFNILKKLYDGCHTFSHGSLISCNHDLACIRIAIAMYIPTIVIYDYLCKKKNIETQINNVDILAKTEKDWIGCINKNNLLSSK